jgi:hypothetical protein
METSKGFGRALSMDGIVVGVSLSSEYKIEREGGYRATSEELAAMGDEAPLSRVQVRRAPIKMSDVLRQTTNRPPRVRSA